jgi:glycosyltransferase involved in cell wall biosynthesis
VRNANKLDYPVVEAIQSILPICDLFVVAVGKSDDDTLQLIQSIQSHKINIIETVWDDSLRVGGKVLADETNKAFAAIPDEYDWAFYIQGDEVLHEQYHKPVLEAMQAHVNNPVVEGLLFDYLHFYGSFDFVGNSLWYRREIRIVRNDKHIFSYGDAQGFRKQPNQKLRVKKANACMYHYGWVRTPEAMQRKNEEMHRFWHDDDWMEKNVHSQAPFDYSEFESLVPFKGSHPAVMQGRIAAKNWNFRPNLNNPRLSIKNKIRLWIDDKTGYLPGEYINFKLI